ncbi:MAG: c-type cytochrome, partial [bacterium]
MLLRVMATPQEQFDAWLASQAAPAVDDQSVALGKSIFMELACSTCHAVQGVSDGAFAPDLTHLMSRDTIASGMVPLGKVHMTEFAFGGWGTNANMGAPRNPWDLTVHRVPGG